MESSASLEGDLRGRQLVDWSAALWAGLIAGTVFFLAWTFLIPLAVGGNPWVMIRLMASLVMGTEVLAPPATAHTAALLVALLTHYAAVAFFAMLLAFILHRWGMVIGILGGAVFGFGLYLIDFYTMTYFFPQLFGFRGWEMALIYVAFGALTGGIYEGLEVEVYEPA